MKKLKDFTVPVAGRISPELKQKFELAAEELDLSLAQYVSLMLTMAEYGETSLVDLKAHLLESFKAEMGQRNEPNQQDDVWKSAPFAGMLDTVLKNERILADLFVTNGNKPISSSELVAKGFKYNVLLQGEHQGKLYYYFTGLHGWTFTDSTKQHVVIVKKR